MNPKNYANAKFSGESVRKWHQCHDCDKPAQLKRCPDCQRAYNTAQSKAWRSKHGNGPSTAIAPETPMKPLSPRDPLVLLILAGWGDLPQPKIPADVREAAEAGKMPRKHPWKRESMRPRLTNAAFGSRMTQDALTGYRDTAGRVQV